LTTSRAVVFDLWDTLVDWPLDAMAELNARWAERLGLTTDDFVARWREENVSRNTVPLAETLRTLGAADGDVQELVDLRFALARRVLLPRKGAVETLVELGERGIRRGLISVCTEEVAAVWPETALAPHFESALFSATSGLMKPDPRIYALACEELGVRPEEALFVGDGANDELAGAERAGLRAVLIHRAGSPPIWPGLERWDGLRVTSVPEVVDLL
jgi:putative hydrolase of the HAD superfamily